MFPCHDWATTPILENIPDSLGDIEIVKTQLIIVRNGIIHKEIHTDGNINGNRQEQYESNLIYKYDLDGK